VPTRDGVWRKQCLTDTIEFQKAVEAQREAVGSLRAFTDLWDDLESHFNVILILCLCPFQI